MKLIQIIIFISTIFLLCTTPVFSLEQKEFDGEIYSLIYTPSEPIFLETITINIGVENTGKQANSFKLKLYISQEGEIKYATTLSFDLGPGSAISLSPTYIPNEVGEYEIIAKLYDDYEVELYDTMIIKFDVVSQIGPFDLSLEVLSRTVKPGEEMPIVLKAINMGKEGTDVRIRVETFCFNQSFTFDEFYVFIDSKSTLDKLASIPVCQETGLHKVSSQIMVGDISWVTSISHFFINETHLELNVKPPELIEVKQGESKVFDIFVENPGNTPVNDLKLVIEKIPYPWTSVKPYVIVDLKPNGMALFVINLSVPRDANPKQYPITITVAGSSILTREESVLKVLRSPTLIPPNPGGNPSAIGQIWQAIITNKIIILAIVVIFVSVGIVFVLLKRRRATRKRYKRGEVLKKLKESVS